MHGESIVFGLMATATSKGSQVKTTEPMDSIKVTSCSIQLGWTLAPDGFTKNYMGSRLIQRPKSAMFSSSACGCMYVIVYFVNDFFNTVEPIEMKLKTYH